MKKNNEEKIILIGSLLTFILYSTLKLKEKDNDNLENTIFLFKDKKTIIDYFKLYLKKDKNLYSYKLALIIINIIFELKLKINKKNLFFYLELDNLIYFYYTKTNVSNKLKIQIKEYFLTLNSFSFDNLKQYDITYKEHNLNKEKIKKIINLI